MAEYTYPHTAHDWVRRLLRALRSIVLVILICLAITLLWLDDSKNSFIASFRDGLMNSAAYVLSLTPQPLALGRDIKSWMTERLYVFEENRYLRKKFERLTSAEEKVSLLTQENASLKKLLNHIPDRAVYYSTARIVGESVGPFSRSALINAGKAHGIAKGNVVRNEDGLVGRIVEVGETSARILLLSDVNSRVPVITKKSREKAVAVGRNTNRLVLMYAAIGHNITEGELLLSAPDGGFFPPDIPVAVVEKVTPTEIIAKPLVTWHLLEYVMIGQFTPPAL